MMTNNNYKSYVKKNLIYFCLKKLNLFPFIKKKRELHNCAKKKTKPSLGDEIPIRIKKKKSRILQR